MRRAWHHVVNSTHFTITLTHNCGWHSVDLPPFLHPNSHGHALALGCSLAKRRKLRVVVGHASDASHEDLHEVRAAKRQEQAGRVVACHRERNLAVTVLGNLLRGVVELQVQRVLLEGVSPVGRCITSIPSGRYREYARMWPAELHDTTSS